MTTPSQPNIAWFAPFALLTFILLAACQSAEPPAPTPTVAAVAHVETPLAPAPTQPPGPVPPTWTAAPAASGVPQDTQPTFTPRPTRTPLILPTATSTGTPTASPFPTATATATGTATPLGRVTPGVDTNFNLLPNGSFEGGWYHINGIPELQVPSAWTLQWEEGQNNLDPDPWNRWVRPESRVLSTDFLPASEHPLFIWDGEQTVKVFKGQGALYFRLFTQVYLEPGSYRFEINVFPDLIDGYKESGEKIWAPDPLSGEVRFLIGEQETEWMLPAFGRRNTYDHYFGVQEARTMRLGAAFRGRWAIENNGWFMDDWGVYRVGD